MSYNFQTLFVGNLLVLVLTMKFMSARLAGTNLTPRWWCSPHLAVRYHGFTPSQLELLIKQFIFFMLGFFLWWGLRFYPSPYLAFPMIWFATEWLGATVSLLFNAKKLPAIHWHPWKSKRLAEFWSVRWNVWISRWLAQFSDYFFPRRPFFKIWCAFIFSGVFHELMFALPYHLATGRAHYGFMMIYFILQAIGISLEKLYLQSSTLLFSRIWTWAWVLIPIPFFTRGAFMELFVGPQ